MLGITLIVAGIAAMIRGTELSQAPELIAIGGALFGIGFILIIDALK